MLQQNNYQLQLVRQEISRQVAFPEELSLSIDEKGARELLNELNQCKTDEELQTFIYNLSRRRLNDLFGAVLTVSVAEGELPVNRLIEIFRRRATTSLAQTAWAFYQRHYPNDRLDRVLATIIKQLASNTDVGDEKNVFIYELSNLVIDRSLPSQLADRARKQPEQIEKARRAISLPDDQDQDTSSSLNQETRRRIRQHNQNHEQYPLLSAYTNLSSLGEQSASANSYVSGLCSYMIRLSIMPDTRFTASFLLSFFSESSDKELQLNSGLFIHALRLSKQSARKLLMQRYLRDYRMSQSWQEINESLLSLCGPTPEKQIAKIGHDLNIDHVVRDSSLHPTGKTEHLSNVQKTAPRDNDRVKSIDQQSDFGNVENLLINEHEANMKDEGEPDLANSSAVKPKEKGFLGWFRRRKLEGDTTKSEANRSMGEENSPDRNDTMEMKFVTDSKRQPEDSIGANQPVGGFKPISLDKLLKGEKQPSSRNEASGERTMQSFRLATPVKATAEPDETTKAMAELQQVLFGNSAVANSGILAIDDSLDDASHDDLINIWQYLDVSIVDRFRQWEYMFRISQHNPDNRRKMLFYQRYSMEIEKITQWDDHGLVIHFPGYVIADYADDVDQVWYYDANTFDMISEQRSPRKALNEPEQQAITSRHAMLRETKNNIVRLQLDAVNLLYSHDFISRVKNQDQNHTRYNGDGLI